MIVAVTKKLRFLRSSCQAEGGAEKKRIEMGYGNYTGMSKGSRYPHEPAIQLQHPRVDHIKHHRCLGQYQSPLAAFSRRIVALGNLAITHTLNSPPAKKKKAWRGIGNSLECKCAVYDRRRLDSKFCTGPAPRRKDPVAPPEGKGFVGVLGESITPGEHWNITPLEATTATRRSPERRCSTCA